MDRYHNYIRERRTKNEERATFYFFISYPHLSLKRRLDDVLWMYFDHDAFLSTVLVLHVLLHTEQGMYVQLPYF